jgi:hypothetical protein
MFPDGLEGRGPSPARRFPSTGARDDRAGNPPFYRPAAAAGLGKARPFIPVPPKRSIEFRFSILSAQILHWCKLDQGRAIPHLNRVFGTIFNMDKTIDSEFDKGLADLKALVGK